MAEAYVDVHSPQCRYGIVSIYLLYAPFVRLSYQHTPMDMLYPLFFNIGGSILLSQFTIIIIIVSGYSNPNNYKWLLGLVCVAG